MSTAQRRDRARRARREGQRARERRSRTTRRHHDGPTTTVKPGEKFTLSLKIQLANWLTYSATQPMEFNLTVPKDIKCDATTLKGDQLKVDGHTLTAQVTCSGPRGIYEARGE